MKSKVYQSQMRSLLKRIVQKRKDDPQEPKVTQRRQELTTTHLVGHTINIEEPVKSRPLRTAIDGNVKHSLINLTIVDEFNLRPLLLSSIGDDSVKCLRPFWTFSGEESKTYHSDTVFRVVNHISYGIASVDIVLGSDYCEKKMNTFEHFFPPPARNFSIFLAKGFFTLPLRPTYIQVTWPTNDLPSNKMPLYRNTIESHHQKNPSHKESSNGRIRYNDASSVVANRSD